MRQADVYVLPSERAEGWGVVANEAMSEGAVLVINEQAGAAEMVEHGKTGFLFSAGAGQDLGSVLASLIREPTVLERVRAAAWESMCRTWHPEEAACRLAALCTGLLGLGPMPEYSEGLCRTAAVKSEAQSKVKKALSPWAVQAGSE
jgi:hypothetical protein